MKLKLIFFLLIISFRGFAQYGKAELDVNLVKDDSLYVIGVYPLGKEEPVYLKTCRKDEYMPLLLDSLKVGEYILKITSAESKELFFSQHFQVAQGKKVVVYSYIDASTTYEGQTDTTRHWNRTDGELNLVYMDHHLMDPKSGFSNGLLLGFGVHYWNAFSKHFGLLTGYGFTYRNIRTAKDTSFLIAGTGYKKKYEAYNYLDIHYDLKFRITGGSQQLHSLSQNFLIEFGGTYNFPLYFRYTGRYQGNKKIEARGIHQFCDFRVFVNAGYYPFAFFYEYRLSNFVIGNYPELPRSTFGIRIFFDAVIFGGN